MKGPSAQASVGDLPLLRALKKAAGGRGRGFPRRSAELKQRRNRAHVCVDRLLLAKRLLTPLLYSSPGAAVANHHRLGNLSP